jgi:hypothetical protein
MLAASLLKILVNAALMRKVPECIAEHGPAR